MEIFEDYAYYYNVFYRDKDYKDEAQQVIVNISVCQNCIVGRWNIFV